MNDKELLKQLWLLFLYPIRSNCLISSHFVVYCRWKCDKKRHFVCNFILEYIL